MILPSLFAVKIRYWFLWDTSSLSHFQKLFILALISKQRCGALCVGFVLGRKIVAKNSNEALRISSKQHCQENEVLKKKWPAAWNTWKLKKRSVATGKLSRKIQMKQLRISSKQHCEENELLKKKWPAAWNTWKPKKTICCHRKIVAKNSNEAIGNF